MSSHFNTPYAALMLDELEDYERLIRELTKHIEKGRSVGAALHNRAVAYWEIGQTEKALNDFDAAISALPGSHMPSQVKGMMLQKQGRLPEAIEAFNVAVAADQNVVTLRRVRAYALMEAGRLEDALRDFDRAIQLEPTFQYTIREREKLLARINSSGDRQ